MPCIFQSKFCEKETFSAMKNKTVSTIKTSAGELKLSEDALCKHTIFIGSTGSGKTTSLNALLRVSRSSSKIVG